MILYVTKIEKGNIGADMHYKALCDNFGRENIFFINLMIGFVVLMLIGI